MTVRRLAFRVLLCLAAAWAVPVRAEDPAARTEPLRADLFDDVVDGIGSVLKILVGPPISSPSPYLNTPDREVLPEEPQPVKVAAPPQPVAPPPAEVSAPSPAIEVQPVAVPAPPPLPPKTPVAAPPAVRPVAVSPPVPPAPPAPRPATPAVAAPATSPPPVAAAVPACSARVAATATVEQMRRLPKCP